MFWMQRNRGAFDIVTKILQGPPNTLAAGFLLKRHTWTQLRGNMIKQEKEKKKPKHPGVSLPAPHISPWLWPLLLQWGLGAVGVHYSPSMGSAGGWCCWIQGSLCHPGVYSPQIPSLPGLQGNAAFQTSPQITIISEQNSPATCLLSCHGGAVLRPLPTATVGMVSPPSLAASVGHRPSTSTAPCSAIAGGERKHWFF